MITTNEVQKNWTEIKAKIKLKWGKFNDLELEGLKDNLDKISDQIQKSYGTAKAQAETEYQEFKKTIQALTAAPQVNAMVSEGSPAPKSQAV